MTILEKHPRVLMVLKEKQKKQKLKKEKCKKGYSGKMYPKSPFRVETTLSPPHSRWVLRRGAVTGKDIPKRE